MEVIYKFDPYDDRADLEIFQQAKNLYCALNDYSNFLRHKLKYGELSEAETKVYEEAREKFYEMLNDNNAKI